MPIGAQPIRAPPIRAELVGLACADVAVCAMGALKVAIAEVIHMSYAFT